MAQQDFITQLNDAYNSLLRTNHNSVTGTGCQNVAELRMAFDILRERLEHKHGEAWGPKKITQAVSERLYETTRAYDNDPDQMNLFQE